MNQQQDEINRRIAQQIGQLVIEQIAQGVAMEASQAKIAELEAEKTEGDDDA